MTDIESKDKLSVHLEIIIQHYASVMETHGAGLFPDCRMAIITMSK